MHEGHRQRMYEKLDNGSDLFDHELLEILLYTAYPRINTNPIAHGLIDRFGSLAEVLRASEDELKEVEGVGEGTARYLRSVGLCAERAGKIEGAASLKTIGDCKSFIGMRMRGREEEVLDIYFVDKGGRLRRLYSYTTMEVNRIQIPLSELVRHITTVRPYGLIVAHNHVLTDEKPSAEDDLVTRKIQFLCNFNGVKFLDHYIYHDERLFSYMAENRIKEMDYYVSLRQFEQWIKNTDL